MDIRSSLDGLRSLLGTTQSTPATAQPARSPQNTAGSSALGSDSATLSSAASQVAQSALDGGVRMDKVTGIQAALANGSYTVQPAAVAAKVVDAMLSAS